MPFVRPPPSKDDLLEALAATFEAGLAPAEALAIVARGGPASARWARLLSERLQTSTLTDALVALKLIAGPTAAVIALGEESGRLPAALRWAVERSRERRDRRRAIRNAVIGPLVFAILTLLLEPLPAVVVGAGSFWPTIRSLLWLGGLVALGVVGLSRLAGHATLGLRLRQLADRTPLVGALVRLSDESEAAALIATFADADTLALAPRAARGVAAPAQVEALTAAAADPLATVATFSEPFALALRVGLRAGDLPARLAAFHRAASATLTARLRAVARVLAFVVVGIVALHGTLKLLATPLPGLSGDLGNLPGMKELERELENAGH